MMKHRLNQHVQAIRLVLARMRRSLSSTLMICSVIGVALCLPAMLYVAVDNVSRATELLQGDAQISLFLKQDIAKSAATALGEQLRRHPSVREVRFVDRDTAWREFRSGLATDHPASSLEQNPLPDAYFVKLKQTDPETVSTLQKEMQAWDGVELAQADASWIKRLYALLQLGKQAVLALAILLAFALTVIIANTIRLQIMTQREEIEVSKLIGATDQFIRRPFLYAGILYGGGGGLAALLLLYAGIVSFNRSVAELALLYGSDFHLHTQWADLSLVLVGTAVIIGWLASYFAVGRSLAKLQQAG